MIHYMAKNIDFLAGPTQKIPSWQTGHILLFRAVNQNIGYTSSVPHADSAI